MQLARRIDFLVEQVERHAEAAAAARLKAGKAEISVQRLQEIIEKRNEMTQRMSEAEGELEAFLGAGSVIADVDIALRDFIEARFGSGSNSGAG